MTILRSIPLIKPSMNMLTSLLAERVYLTSETLWSNFVHALRFSWISTPCFALNYLATCSAKAKSTLNPPKLGTETWERTLMLSMFFSRTVSVVPKNWTIDIWKLWLPMLKKPIFTGSESFLVIAKWIAAAEFSLITPRTLISARYAALMRANLALNPQWAGTVKTASLMSEPAC